MSRLPRPYWAAPEKCPRARWVTSRQGEQVRVTCREAGCSRECADARAEVAARDLIAQFFANPPTHMVRVSVHDEDIHDEEIEKRIRNLCRALKRHGCREYVDAVHFFEARRHDHIAVIYDGDAADPEAHLRNVVDRVFVGLHITRYAQPREKEPPALARYLVQALKPENKRDVELPPEGFDGKRLLRRSRGYNIKRKQEQPQQVYEMSADFPFRVVDTGDELGVTAYTFDADAIGAYTDGGRGFELSRGPAAAPGEVPRQAGDEVVPQAEAALVVSATSGGRDHIRVDNRVEEGNGMSNENQEHETYDPVAKVTIFGRRPKQHYEWDWYLVKSRYGEHVPDHHRGYIEATALPVVDEERSADIRSIPSTGAAEVHASRVVAREEPRLDLLWKPIRALFSRRADPRDGALERIDIMTVLNSYITGGGIPALDEALDALVETGFLEEIIPDRFVLAR